MSAAFDLLARPIQKWIRAQGWTGLRPLQAGSIRAIMGGEADQIVAASTAGGKTEAAFLPLISQVLLDPGKGPGFDLLYIGPLKALITDQARRLDDVCHDTGLPVVPWHGDVSAGIKARALKDPRGILLITPESLEALLIRRGSEIPRLFGATRARRDSAAQQLRSAEAQTVAARLAVAANTAQGYLQLRALQGQRSLLVEGIEVARELERIAGLLFHAGEVTRLDVEATSAERASLEADLDELDIHLAEAQLALDTLLAAPPGSSAVQLAASTAVPLAESRIAAGQPIDLLRRRPDLIAEAARLDAAELQSLAARRDLFPKLAVQAAVGRSGFALGDAVSSASNFARVGATFGLPLLDYPRRGAAIDLADAEGETAYVAFEQALARALEEVERGLTRMAGQQRRHASLSRTREHRERAHRLAQRSYELGEANLSEVLDAQRGALQAKRQALEGRTELATAQVALYVALGGGWQAEAADAAARPAEKSAQ